MQFFLKSNSMKKQPKKICIPYHVNPAIIKAHLRSVPKKELGAHAHEIYSLAAAEPPGTSRRAMFVRLYQYCLQLLN